MPKKNIKITLMLLFLTLGTAGWLLADDDDDDHGGKSTYRRPGTSLRVLAPVANPAWKEECSSCHMLYHPGLLPARSWQKMMGGLDNHFGDNASLEPAIRDEIAAFLAANSADHSNSIRSMKIARSILPSEEPLRISETRYFSRKHDEIRADVFKRKQIGSAANCAACHKQAESGDFSEEQVRIPR